MKMWAVFDKDGNIESVMRTEVAAISYIAIHTAAKGFTCQPVVVMRESVYNAVATPFLTSGIHETEGDDYVTVLRGCIHRPILKEFLNAGQ